MDVLFANPPWVEKVGGHMRYGCRAGSRWPWSKPHGLSDYAPFPFFMAYAASFLERHNVQVGLYDAVAIREISYDAFYQYVKKACPKIVVLETSTPTIHIDLQVAKKLSEILPNSEIALSGSHATVFAENLIKLPYITYILKGEYEVNSLEMWRTRRPGIYEYTPIEDIDSSPYPYRDPKVISKYWDPSMVKVRPQLQIYASRGCPFSCTFCMWTAVMYRGKYRVRSPEKVIEEIQYCVSKFRSSSIFFDDDTWNIGDDRISRLCDGLKKIGLHWSMMGRTDTSPLWLFDKMVDCGCRGMRFGVETFCEKVQKRINKKLDPNNAIETLKYLTKKYPHVKLHITTMKNLPTETKEDREYNLKIIKDLGFTNTDPQHTHQCATCIPFPGTKLYFDLLKQGHGNIVNNFTLYDGSPDREDALSRLIRNMKE